MGGFFSYIPRKEIHICQKPGKPHTSNKLSLTKRDSHSQEDEFNAIKKLGPYDSLHLHLMVNHPTYFNMMYAIVATKHLKYSLRMSTRMKFYIRSRTPPYVKHGVASTFLFKKKWMVCKLHLNLSIHSQTHQNVLYLRGRYGFIRYSLLFKLVLNKWPILKG